MASSRTRPGFHESTSAGDPQRVSPISAWSRAMSVEICSGDGSGRVMQRELDDAGRRRIDGHDHAIDGGRRADATRGRAAPASAACAHPASASAAAAIARAPRALPSRRLTSAERTCSTAAPRSRRSRCASSGSSRRPSTKDQRLEPFDRPLEIERLLEALFRHRRHQRRGVLTAREPLPSHAGLPQSRRDSSGGNAARSPKRAHAPAAKRLR